MDVDFRKFARPRFYKPMLVSLLVVAAFETWGWIGCILHNKSTDSEIFPYVANKSRYGAVWGFFGALVGCLIFITVFLPETKGKTLEEIEKNIEGSGYVIYWILDLLCDLHKGL